jgi:hypothetical protein
MHLLKMKGRTDLFVPFMEAGLGVLLQAISYYFEGKVIRWFFLLLKPLITFSRYEFAVTPFAPGLAIRERVR